jgi:hypothetical protein
LPVKLAIDAQRGLHVASLTFDRFLANHLIADFTELFALPQHVHLEPWASSNFFAALCFAPVKAPKPAELRRLAIAPVSTIVDW